MYLDMDKWFRRNRKKNMVWNTAETEVSVSVVDVSNASFMAKDGRVYLTSDEVLKATGFKDEDIENLSMYIAAHEGAHVRYSDIVALDKYLKDMKARKANMKVADGLVQTVEDYRVDSIITKVRPGYGDLRRKAARGSVEHFAEEPSGDPLFDETKAISCMTYGYDLRQLSSAWEHAVDWSRVEAAARHITEHIDELLEKGETTSYDATRIAEEVYAKFYGDMYEEDEDDGEGGSGSSPRSKTSPEVEPKGQRKSSSSGSTRGAVGKGESEDGKSASEGDKSEGEDGGSDGKGDNDGEDKDDEKGDGQDDEEKGDGEHSGDDEDETDEDGDGEGDDEDSEDGEDKDGEGGDVEVDAKNTIGGLPGFFGEKARKTLEKHKERIEMEEREKELLTDSIKTQEERAIQSFPKSLWTPAEKEEYVRALCHGPHAGMTLHYCLPKRSDSKELTEHMRTEARILTSQIRDMLRAARDADAYVARSGSLDSRRVWRASKVGRSDIFRKSEYTEEGGYVVDILLDASGSQLPRESKVAQAAWVISTAIVGAGISCRVTSFRNYENVTIIERFRDYEDPVKQCDECLRFHAGGDNRDGLAILTVGRGLLKRPEERKVLVVLSDGAPWDTSGSDAAQVFGGIDSYTMEFSIRGLLLDKSLGVQDTAKCVRELRKRGVSVLGVYIGNDDKVTLEAERYIYGNDFAKIKTMDGFARTVARYLQKQISQFREE